MRVLRAGRSVFNFSLVVAFALLGGAAGALLGVCGPFTDVAADAFCPFVLEVFTLGITTGTSPTTYDPASNVSRLQMAAFLSRSVDRVLQRGNRRAALRQFWTPQNGLVLGVTALDDALPSYVESDGVDLWVSHSVGAVSRVRGADGKLLETWTGATSPGIPLVAMGRIFISGSGSPGKLYRLDPGPVGGVVTTLATNLGGNPTGSAFDGSRIWTANTSGSVSIVTPAVTPPWSVATVSSGFSAPIGILYDGANIWVGNSVPGTLVKLDPAGAILQTVTVGTTPYFPTFDGTNIWVPNFVSNSVSVVRASTGAVLATLTANGLDTPATTAFDGQRIMATNNGSDSVSLWKAADLTPLGSFSTGTDSGANAVCSDGVNFWVVLRGSTQLAKF